MDTKDLLLHYFLEWQIREKEKKTLKEFSMLIGMSPQMLNHYWTGKRIPTLEIADMFYSVFGDDRFFTVCGYEIPDHRLKFLNNHWGDFSEIDKDKIMELFSKYKTGTRERNAAARHHTKPVE